MIKTKKAGIASWLFLIAVMVLIAFAAIWIFIPLMFSK